MRVSVFRNYKSVEPKATVSIIDWLEDDTYLTEVESIREIADKSKRDKLKAALTAITPSGIFSHRAEKGLLKHSGFIQFDIDKIEVNKIEKYKRVIASMPYTFYVGLSVSGLGLWGLFKIDQPHLHKKHFTAMVQYFKDNGIKEIDAAPSNVSSLRGYAYDKEGYRNYYSNKPFDLRLKEPKNYKVNKAKIKINSSVSVADDFNLRGDIEPLLIEHGYTYVDTKGTNNRYTRPGKTSGISANYCTKLRLLYVWSTDPETGLKVDEPKAFNNWAVFVQLECKGNQTEAARKLYGLGYGNPLDIEPYVEPLIDLYPTFKIPITCKREELIIKVAGFELTDLEINKILV
jgi:hypothetical protein